MNDDRLTRLANQLRDLADLLDQHGHLIDTRLNSWTPGPQPGDTHNTPPQPGDPDYDGPAPTPDWLHTLTDDDHTDQARAARLAHQWNDLLTQLERAATRLPRFKPIAIPPTRTHRGRPDTPTDYATDGYCRSCARLHHLEPIALRPDGRARYRDLCRWCGEWAATHDTNLPPRPLLAAHHRGDRITPSLIARLT